MVSHFKPFFFMVIQTMVFVQFVITLIFVQLLKIIYRKCCSERDLSIETLPIVLTQFVQHLSKKSLQHFDLHGVKRYLNFLRENLGTDRAEWALRCNLQGN